jgi:type IV pilus assembly protein PilV
VARVTAAGRGARGPSLIEALVALLVLGVGLLGIAALYTHGRISDRSTELRARAVELAADLAERMRANRAAGAAYDDARSALGYVRLPCAQSGRRCTPEQLARHDKAEWLEAVRDGLPGASASVRAGGPGHTLYTIALHWREPALGAGDYVLRFEP